MPEGSSSPNSSARFTAKGQRLLTALAVVAAVALAVLSGVRPLSSPDLGYHLAYGEQFLDTGRIVDHNAFVYTLPAGDPLPPPGPGCWYDADGKYRFANANWLSQVVMAAAWRAGGPTGVCVLQAVLVAAIFTIVLLAMRRLGVPWPGVAAGILLAATTAYMRLTIRPEVFGYLLLAAQLFVLVGKSVNRRAVASLAVLQLLLVNCHSYFLLGPAMTAAFLSARLIAWRRPGLGPASLRLRGRQVRTDAKLLAVALAGQLLVCLANPWTWRLAILPVQTLLFMHANKIASGELTGPGGHPWSYIGEFFRPLAGEFLHTKATYAYVILLAVGAIGAVGAVFKRRWEWFAVIVAMLAVSLSMRRNIAPAGLLVAPLAIAAICAAWRRVWRGRPAKLRAEITREGAGILLATAAWLCLSVVTQRFYFGERSAVRFGVGLSQLQLPIGAAGWINANRPEGRIWTDYTSSSNVHYFTGGREVPILTNTWAYPPEIMREVLNSYLGGRDFAELERRYGFDCVVLRADRSTSVLVGELAAGERWRLAYLDAMFVVFVRDLPAADAITKAKLDLARHVARLKASDPVPAHALHVGGLTLFHLGWDTAAAELFTAAVEEDPSYHEAWNMKGLCLAREGSLRLRQTGDKELLRRARDCFREALAIKSDYQPALANLQLVDSQLRSGSAPAVQRLRR